MSMVPTLRRELHSGISSSRKKKKEVHAHSIDVEVDIHSHKVDVIFKGLMIRGVVIDGGSSINVMIEEIMSTLGLCIM